MNRLEQYKAHIEARQNSEAYKYFMLGDAYYRQRNTAIIERKRQVYLEGIGPVDNPFAADYRLPRGYLKKIVDQLVGYLLGNGCKFDTKDNAQTDNIDQYFETSFDKTLLDMAFEARKKAESWLYFYKNSEGKTKSMVIPAEQCFPVYDDYGKLEAMIRSYRLPGKLVSLVFDKEGITRYEKDGNGAEYAEVGRYGHYSAVQLYNGKAVGEPELLKFDRVPFIPLYADRDKASDLYRIKALIDAADFVTSDFANNVEDMQEVFLVLKGYTGDTKHIAEFTRQLKQLKAVPVDSDGGVEAVQNPIPVEAREKLLDRLDAAIYDDSMSVDTKNISGGSTLTNVHIRAMFANLDLKADAFENELRGFIGEVVDFLNANEAVTYENTPVFNRMNLINRQEEIQTLAGTSGLHGVLSREGMLRQLASLLEIDITEELARIAQENGEMSAEQLRAAVEKMEQAAQQGNE
jgi:SPP1 family phage portal protein